MMIALIRHGAWLAWREMRHDSASSICFVIAFIGSALPLVLLLALKQGAIGHLINDITEDADGMLWIATNGGASRFNPSTEQFTRYQHDPGNENSLGGDTIISAFVDSVGNIWFGGIPPNGLNKLNPETGVIMRYRAGEK